jgi:hypothetical protein
MCPTCIGLATFGELKSTTTVRGCAALSKNRCSPRVNVEFGEDVRGELTRVQLSRLGQRHQRVALVIAEFCVRARTNEHDGNVRLRQDRADGGLQAKFDLFVRQHGNYLTTDEHGLPRRNK